MDLLHVYSVVNKTLLNVVDSINILDRVEYKPTDCYVHLIDEPFILSANIEKFTKVITAHKLSQYTNKIHSVKLDDEISTWFDLLIEDDLKERERIIME